jgi:hypothetical protein
VTDLLLGVLLLLEFVDRLAAHPHPMHWLDNASVAVDVVVILPLFCSTFIINYEIGDFPRCTLLHPDDALDHGFWRQRARRSTGRLLSIATMIVGISLFFRLAQAVFRSAGKVRHPCLPVACSAMTMTPSTTKRAGCHSASQTLRTEAAPGCEACAS